MRTPQHDETKPMRFRAATLDEAVMLAEQSLGSRTRVIEANQLRRGGIGGFFASDLGVEISVVVDDEVADDEAVHDDAVRDAAGADGTVDVTVDAALERLVDEVAAQERERWRERAEPAETAGANLVLDDFAAALRAVEAATAHGHESPRTSGRTPRRELANEYVETFAPAVPARVEAPVAPTEPQPAAVEPAAVEPAAPALSKLDRLEAAFESLRNSSPMKPKNRPSAPTQRHVELVVAAAEQLIETIATRTHAANVSVRVVMRNSEGAEVEAFAGLDSRLEVAS